MEQARYWIWTNRKHVFASQTANNNSSSSSPSYGDSWEEQAFAEDAAGSALGGCVWPPRSYSCSFCRREFKSAQALGGHMNVHRRDRARLKQSPTSQLDAGVNLNPPSQMIYSHTSSSPVRVSSSSPPPEKMSLGLAPPFFSTVAARSNLTALTKSNDREYVKSDLSAVSTLNLLFSRARDSDDGVGEIPRCNKRRRFEYEDSPTDDFLLWKSSISESVQERCKKRLQTDVPKVVINSGELDLELRLGDPPKV